MREIKFRVWDGEEMMYPGHVGGSFWTVGDLLNRYEENRMQFTGLKDKDGKEIYEFHEINKEWRVIYQPPKYVLQNISNGDIIDIYEEQNKREITGEYSPI